MDASFLTADAPNTAVTELANTYDFNILSIDNQHLNALQKQYQFYTDSTLPGGIYSCVPNDIKTVAVMANFIVRNDLSEDVVYTFTKGLFENKTSFQPYKGRITLTFN